MADWGSVNNTTSTGTDDSNRTWISGGDLIEAGTLDSVFAYVQQQFSSPLINVAVYQGGSAGSISGASLVFEGTAQAPGAAAWLEFTANGESLAADYTWICVSENNNASVHSVGAASYGDFDGGYFYWTSQYTGSAFPATAPAFDGTHNSNEVVKARLTYTAAGGSTVPVLAHTHRMLMGNH